MSEMSSVLSKIPDVSFIDYVALEDLKNEMVADFEAKYKELTGNEITLGAADPSRLILYACALQIYQAYQYIDRAGKQDLLKYSSGEYLDNLAALKGIVRLEASAATTILRFSLEETRNSVTSIPKGTRVTGNSMDVYFVTDEYAEIPIDQLYVDVTATCETDGTNGNGYVEGKINVLVDLLPYVESVKNITTTQGGADIEADEDLAERVYLAPSRYSVAGPADAYKYWTKAFNAAIDDINVSSPKAGEVCICFLMDGELPNEAIISGLEEFLKNNSVRPMTDLVTVLAPDEETYDIEVKYYINKSDSNQAVTISIAVEKAAQEYVKWQRKIGRDINPSELIKQLVSAGAKRVEVMNPVFKNINATTVPKLNEMKVVYGGIEDD